MILRSMRLIGEKARGAVLDTNEQTECLAELNTFMDATANEKLLCYSVHQDSFPLSTGTSSYTIGVNGTVAVTRPTKVVDPCFVRDASGYDSPVRVISAETYGRLVSKGAGNTIPQVLYYDNGFSATSTATMFVYPVPSTALTLFFSSWQQLQAFAALSTTVLLPPGYQLFIETNFAIHLAAGQVPVSPELAKMARDAKAAVKSVNLPSTFMKLDRLPTRTNSGSILTGDGGYYVGNDYVE